MPTPTLRPELVRKKLKGIRFDLEKLRALAGENLRALPYEEERLTNAERRLERMINRAIDINLHLIRASGAPPPNDYTESFQRLGELKIIAPELARDLAPAAGARNILIHAYDDVDTEEFLSSVEDALRLFPQYLAHIEQYLDAGGTPPQP